MAREQLAPKLVGETILYSFTFTGRYNKALASISTKVVTATVYSGVDSSPSSIISGAAAASTLDSGVIQQLITAGVVGTIYELICTATLSTGEILIASGLLSVIRNSP